jgi:DeoR/GlpR family transcriptional regulator of sugar metabolism
MNKVMERRNRIIEQLKILPIATVSDLTGLLSVSNETIRNDLLALEREGVIMRVHGGAALKETPSLFPFSQRKSINAEGKERIARTVASMIAKDSSLILEASTTNVAVTHVLLSQPELLKTLIVITNSLHICTLLQGGKLCGQLFFLGGWINTVEFSSHGSSVIATLRDIHADLAVLSAAALSEEGVLTAYYETDVLFQRQAIGSASKTMLLCDKSKFGQSTMMKVTEAGELDYLITDSDEAKEKLVGKRLRVVLC